MHFEIIFITVHALNLDNACMQLVYLSQWVGEEGHQENKQQICGRLFTPTKSPAKTKKEAKVVLCIVNKFFELKNK